MHGQATQEDIDRAIDQSKLKHPYLYFSEKEKPAILERIKNDPESAHLHLYALPISNSFQKHTTPYRGGGLNITRGCSHRDLYFNTL